MSAISSATSAYRVFAENSLAPAPPARAPQRETELTRQLDERLSGEIARIRRQISPNTPAVTDPSEDLGRVLDIRA